MYGKGKRVVIGRIVLEFNFSTSCTNCAPEAIIFLRRRRVLGCRIIEMKQVLMELF